MLPRPSDPVAVAVIVLAGLAAAAIDLRTRRVPNALTGAVAVMGLALAGIHAGSVSLVMAIAGCAAGLALMLPGYVLGATGGGDVKLFAAMGTLVGPRAILFGFLYTAIAGGVIAVAVALMRSSLRQTVGRAAAMATGGVTAAEVERPLHNNRFAYAPAIAIGVVAAALRV